MKAIIYAGITLFSAATVYGVADYYRETSKGKLTNLYLEEEPVEKPGKVKALDYAVVPQNDEANVRDASIEKNKALKTGEQKASGSVRRIKLDDFSRGRIPPPVEAVEEILPVVLPLGNNIDSTGTFSETIKPTGNFKEISPEAAVPPRQERRRISLENFSRAPLKYKKVAKKN